MLISQLYCLNEEYDWKIAKIVLVDHIHSKDSLDFCT